MALSEKLAAAITVPTTGHTQPKGIEHNFLGQHRRYWRNCIPKKQEEQDRLHSPGSDTWLGTPAIPVSVIAKASGRTLPRAEQPLTMDGFALAGDLP